jgi:tetratricopeptide (TPR) repeat protein
MVRPGTPPEPLLSALADGRAVLFVGAGFSHGVTQLDWSALLEALRPHVGDPSGWDALDPRDRAQLYVETHGRERLETELAALLPSAEALRSQVTEFHRQLLSLPCPVIVTSNYDGLVEATLESMDEPYRLVIEDDDVERALAVHDGTRLVVKMHGDVILGDQIVLTRDDYLAYTRSRPAIAALLRSLLLDHAFLFYGFGLADPNFMLLYDEVLAAGARSRPAYALMKEPNALLVQYWARRKVEIVSGNTFGELEKWIEGLARDVERRRRSRYDLETILDDGFPEEKAGIQALVQELQAAFTRRLSGYEDFRWVRLTPAQAEGYADEGEEIQATFRVLRALSRASMPVPPATFANAAELLLRFGHPEDARSAVDLCLRTARGLRRPLTPELRGALGRTLCRLGELERARPLLEKALVEGDGEDVESRTAELAWLCRAVLERIDDLRDRQRERAAREVLGRFLATYAAHFTLAEPTVEPTAEPIHEAYRWSLYYVGFRLGRLFAIASEMAGQSGSVYAQKAVDHLAKAVERVPSKPEPYRVLRPLLLAPRGTRPDKARWERLVTQAPPEVRRKLEELESSAAARARSGPSSTPRPPKSV